MKAIQTNQSGSEDIVRKFDVNRLRGNERWRRRNEVPPIEKKQRRSNRGQVSKHLDPGSRCQLDSQTPLNPPEQSITLSDGGREYPVTQPLQHWAGDSQMGRYLLLRKTTCQSGTDWLFK